jgi:hypothetical protein
MPAASLIDSYLAAPFNRKFDFHAAFKSAVEASGFPTTDIDVFELTNRHEFDASFGGPIGGQFVAGQVGAIKGFVKEIVFNGSAKGTIQVCFFTRSVADNRYGGYGITLPYLDIAFVPGFFVIQGGWNSVTKTPNNNLSTIGGYTYNSPPNDVVNQNLFWGNYAQFGTLGSPAHIGASVSDRTRTVLNMVNPIKFTAVNHGEIRGVYIQQAEKVPMFVGIVRPSSKPTSWNENLFPYCYASDNSSFFSLQSFYGANNPYNIGIAGVTLVNFPGCVPFSYAIPRHVTDQVTGIGRADSISNVPVNPVNALTGKIDVITAPYLMNLNVGAGQEVTKWLTGQFSDDIVVTISHKLDFRDKIIITPGIEEYTVITAPEITSNNAQEFISYRKIGNTTYFAYYVLAIRTT